MTNYLQFISLEKSERLFYKREAKAKKTEKWVRGHISWPFYQDMLFLVKTLTPRSQKSSLDIEECTTKDANDIFNEITGGIHECDLIDSENISDDIFIPKDSAALNLSNDSESMSCVGSPSFYYKCPKRKNNDMDDYRKLMKIEADKALIILEMLKNKSTEHAICLML
ncbi:uncharacterized protein LOC135931288 isoform X3 [Gordionus sp. m RMFG-2023]|uniref:uncharacterized protein LOC135931288 isoform X3 n=1 Tax=Gordionus sp. m RMFG-2023 TaxID=3053472 RepID=UPI0031FBA5EA